MSIQSWLTLRNVLRLDAATCVASGLASIVGASSLSALFGLPEQLLRGAGAILLGFAALLVFAALSLPRLRWPSWLAVLGNAVWVLESVLVLLSDEVALTTLGVGYVLAQAVVVALLAELEFAGLRKLATREVVVLS
jgi:hypothetical protein